jgi:hypothetical protein
MSWQAAAWMDALPYDVMKPLATRVLLKLANVAGQNGESAYRNIWEVAAELGVDRRSIQRSYRELEAAELIHKGHQGAVLHMRPDRRPTVYDLNFGYQREFGQPELPLPEEGEPSPADHPSEWGDFHGATELSTGGHGATYGATTEVPLGTKGTIYTSDEKESLEPEQAQAPKIERQSRTTNHGPDARAELCRGRTGLRPHEFNAASGWCEHCETRAIAPETAGANL